MSLEQELDSSSAAGELSCLRCPLAQFERRFIAERTRDGMNAARAKGAGTDDLRSSSKPLLLLVKGGVSPTKTARRTALVLKCASESKNVSFAAGELHL